MTPGTFIVLQAEFEHNRCGAFAQGARQKPAEKVVDEAVEELRCDLASGGAIDVWLADQLLLPLVFAPGPSDLSVSRISRHLLTNAELLAYFLPVSVEMKANSASAGWCVFSERTFLLVKNCVLSVDSKNKKQALCLDDRRIPLRPCGCF